MRISSPPRPPRRSDPVTHDELEALVEALIEEARRRTRRRRRRYGAAALLVTALAVAAFIGFGGRDGGGAGAAPPTRAPGVDGPTANAQSPTLAALPPGAGQVDSFAFDPRNPRIVYVIASRGVAAGGNVFKTTDDGAHWQATATSGSGWRGANLALVADSRHPGTLYAGTQVAVYKTVNGGRSWRPSRHGLSIRARDERSKGSVIALAVDPANANVVYAGSDRVSRSSDGGRSWKAVFPPHPVRYRDSVSALAIAPTRPAAIYAITADFADRRTSIYESTDAGTTWHARTVVRGIQGGGLGLVTALAVDPRHPSTVYAALGAAVLKTTDSGTTWRPIGRGLPIAADLSRGGCHCRGGVTTLAVDPRRTGAVYAALSQGGIYKTTDGGRTWIRVISAGLSLNYTVAVDPARPGTIYAAAESATGDGPRILRSTDGGRTWETAG